MTEIEIPDAPRSGGENREGAERSPRRFVLSIVVIPAALVGAIVLIVLAFGLITGRAPTPRENVERLLHGSASARERAAFDLVGQVLGAAGDPAAGGPEAWGLDAQLVDGLRLAWEEHRAPADPDEVPLALTLTILLAHLGDAAAIDELAAMTGLAAALDPDGTHRFFAVSVLGNLGEELTDPQRARAAAAMMEVLAGDDPGLRTLAAAALGRLPAPATELALRDLLAAPSAELRLTAALSLAELGDAAGADVLREMCGREPYDAERAADPAKWAGEAWVGDARCKALRALYALGEELAPGELARLSREDADPELRALAQALGD